ncbi:phospholipid carrier-dependent glycosyltransferase [Lacinutrix neustonica]|uniref:Phospholipid carrier-dependent glycosyltransferase n=1 Tax=Lacinutrix neustonica TaxID=2980107 RepID=A0A9E8N0T4_9FLAO|nr:phospholipid carrier-dependent glycosyltransferase [Lacinutrix neustonica]WAC03779.1 phospholipid carrier-dependent glycosyltransferase [Lacinutrix neustonica]
MRKTKRALKLQKLTPSFYENLTLFGIPLLFVFLLKIAGFDGLYGQDSYEYLRYTIAIQDYIVGGEHPGHYFWPVLYPTLGSGLSFIMDSAFALQLISCLTFSIASLYVLKTIRLLYSNSRVTFLYVYIFVLLSPFLLKMSLIVMSDALALVFIVLSFYFFFKSYYKKTSLAPVFIFATCALMTRYASLFVTFPILIYTLYLVINRRQFQQLFIAILLSFIVAIPFLIFQWAALFEASSNYFLKVWSVSNYFKSSYTTEDGTQHYLFPNLLHTFYLFFHPGFLCIGFFLSAITLRDYKTRITFHQTILILCSALYILFLAGIPFQNPRILGLVFPLVLIWFFPAFQKLMNMAMVKAFFTPLKMACIGLQVAFFTMTFHHIFSRTLIEKEIATMITPYQGKTLYSFDVDMAMQGRGLDFKFKNMYTARYYDFKEQDLILFDPARHKVQWKDKNPMLNWEFIKENYVLEVLETHPEGWKLYQIQ